jgi:trimeric autotransporter adhesin
MQARHCLSPVIPLLLMLAAAMTLSLPAVTQEATATVPRLITFSGTLGSVATAADESGVVIAPATAPTKVVAVTFSLYSEETGGAALWSEVQNVHVDSTGHYTVELGASKPDGLPMDIFASVQAHWLGVQPQDHAEQPRVLLVSVPYALKSADAETFGGLPPSAYQLAPAQETNQATAQGTGVAAISGAGNSSTGSGKPPVVTLVYGNGTPGYIPLWNSFTSETSSTMYQNPATKYIGIGTIAPIASLAVTNNNMDTAFAGITTASTVPAIFALNQATSGQSLAIKAQTLSTTGIAVAGRASAVTGSNVGAEGESDSSSGIGVLGVTTASSGSTIGVDGQNNSPNGAGVVGSTYAPTGPSSGVEGLAIGPDATAVLGYNKAATGQATGVEGQSDSLAGVGVFGVATAVSGKASGVLGNTSSPTGFGVYGENTATAGSAYGVGGSTASGDSNASGVYGQATSVTGATNGVFGATNSTDGNADGVYGLAIPATGGANGVQGTTYAPNGYGVWGIAKSTDPGTSYGVYGQSVSGDAVHGLFTGVNGSGVVGVANTSGSGFTEGAAGINLATTGPSNGVYGTTASPAGAGGIFENTGGGLSILARVNANQNSFSVDGAGNGWFNGNLTVKGGGSNIAGTVTIAGDLNVNGNLNKLSGSFKIDDPIDPSNKYLSHSFVESPDMLNIYNGVVRLDARGEAWVVLPSYFEALNRDFRYQLTSVGSPQPRLYIAREVNGNRFKISGGRANGKVSWLVTGVRQDAWANDHRIPNEEDKLEKRGTYLYPGAYRDKSGKNTNAMLQH